MQLKEKLLNKRQKYFTLFLQAIARSEILKSCPEFLDFVTVEGTRQWEQTVQKYSRQKKGLKDLVMPEGKLDVSINQKSMLFCNNLKNYNASSTALLTEAIEISKEIDTKCKDLASSYL